MSSKRAIQNWNMKYVYIVRSPGSALRVFTSSERLANQLKINDIGEVGKPVTKIEMECSENRKIGEGGVRWMIQKLKIGVVGQLVKRIEMDGPQTRKLMKKVETGDGKVRELVQKIQANDPKVGKVWKLARFGQEEHK